MSGLKPSRRDPSGARQFTASMLQAASASGSWRNGKPQPITDRPALWALGTMRDR